MNILEEAEALNIIAQEIADKKGITVQEAWSEAIEELKEIQKENKEFKI